HQDAAVGVTAGTEAHVPLPAVATPAPENHHAADGRALQLATPIEPGTSRRGRGLVVGNARGAEAPGNEGAAAGRLVVLGAKSGRLVICDDARVARGAGDLLLAELGDRDLVPFRGHEWSSKQEGPPER